MHPFVVRHAIIPLHERLMRRDTVASLRRLDDSQWWSPSLLTGLQITKLRNLLIHASDHCPFYRRRLDEAGIDPCRADHDTLRQLPTLSKSDIREHQADLIDPGSRQGLRPYTTGGSTGSPLSFFINRQRQASDQAARARSRRWFGIDVGEREAYLWGSPIERVAQDRVKKLRDHLTNHLLLDAFDMTPARMASYLATLRRFDPVHIFGYPSSIARLCRFARQAGGSISNPSLRAVFVSGEVFQPTDRAIIEECVDVPVADGYGSREGGFVAHQCPLGSYHVTMESHIVELLDPNGRPVDEGSVGEITLTHLDAYGMPFIRYRTGDLARFGGEACPCGRGLDVIGEIKGRSTDMLRTTGGGFAHGLSVIYVMREMPEVEEFRIEQRANLDLDVFMVLRGKIGPDGHRVLTQKLRERIGPDISVNIHVVDRIPPDPSGKHRHVVGPAE